MEEKDSIKDLFQEKLSQLETPVRPELWSAVSSSIASTSTVATATGMSLLAKITIGITIAASVTGTILFISKEDAKESPKTESKKIKSTKTATKSIENTSTPNVSNTENNKINLIEKTSENNISFVSNSEELTPFNNVSSEYKLMEGPISYAEIEQKQETNKTHTKPETQTNNTVSTQNKETSPTVEKLPEQSKVQIKLPNIFTPNGDGNNDFLKIEIENITEFVIVVLDSKSNVVFKSEDADFKWDGTNFNGDKLPAGNYIYYVTANDSDGKPLTKYSSLTIKY
jgi:gliding motility-associated-like protein